MSDLRVSSLENKVEWLEDQLRGARAEAARLREALKRIMSMAGAPDAAEACRNIIKVARAALSAEEPKDVREPREFVLRGGGPHCASYIHKGQGLLRDDEEIRVREVISAEEPKGKKAMCKCDVNPAEPAHTCPYAEDINNDSDTLCTCCRDCQYQCAMDI